MKKNIITIMAIITLLAACQTTTGKNDDRAQAALEATIEQQKAILENQRVSPY